MARSRWKATLLWAGAIAAAAAMLAIGTLDRRPDLIDPAEIAKLPSGEIRGAELERLVRQAFLEAQSVHIRSEASPSITITNPAVLSNLADRFSIGDDDEQLPMYQHPGLEYTVITFDGPYKPQLSFTGPKDVRLKLGKSEQWPHFVVGTSFARTLADLLQLKLARQ